MNRSLLAIGACLCGLLLAGCLGSGDESRTAFTQLSPCSASGTIFKITNPAQSGSFVYHARVGEVVEEHIDSLRDIAETPLQCSASNYRSLVKPSPQLQSLAATLPPWRNSVTLGQLSQADIGTVLLEFSRIYECHLLERENFLSVLLASGSTVGNIRVWKNRGVYGDDLEEESAFIRQELQTARPSLDRTLSILGGIDQLRPLVVELECIKRLSLDLRNVTGLISEAFSCTTSHLGDARGALREPEKIPKEERDWDISPEE